MDPEAVFAEFTNETFVTKVDPSFATREKLEEMRLDFAKVVDGARKWISSPWMNINASSTASAAIRTTATTSPSSARVVT